MNRFAFVLFSLAIAIIVPEMVDRHQRKAEATERLRNMPILVVPGLVPVVMPKERVIVCVN